MFVQKIIVVILTAMAMFSTVVHAERGSDGQLNLIYWQAPSILNPYLSGGSKIRKPPLWFWNPSPISMKTATWFPCWRKRYRRPPGI